MDNMCFRNLAPSAAVNALSEVDDSETIKYIESMKKKEKTKLCVDLNFFQ